MASASSSALAASITAMSAIAASACAAKPASRSRSRHSSLAAAGRSASEVSRSRPCAVRSPSVGTLSRRMPIRVSNAAMANCGCPCAESVASPLAMIRQVGSSRSVSRPGSTSAPRGSRAMVASSVAVAGIEPVDPAAITGPLLAARRLASAAISRSRRSAGSMRPRSARMAGQFVRMNRRKSSVSSQYLSSSSGTSPSSLPQPTCRVAMSSIRRARSLASAKAVAGLLATSGA